METLVVYLLVYTLRIEWWDKPMSIGGPMETEYMEVYRAIPVLDAPKEKDGSRIVPGYTATIADLASNEHYRFKGQMRSCDLIKWKVYEVDLANHTTKDVTHKVIEPDAREGR